MSTIRLITMNETNASVDSSTTTPPSLSRIAWNRNWPSPGRLKMLSVRTAPAKMPAKSMPDRR